LNTSPWIAACNSPHSTKLRLFCFPYAGGGASAYRKWASALPPGVQLLAAQLPGREGRFVEPPLRDLDSVLRHLVSAIEPLLDRPFVFFGHSLGALVAFELTRSLRSLGRPMPAHLFVSGRRAPSIPIGRRAFHDLPDDELIEEIRQLNGASEALLENDEVMALLLPTLRADFAIHDTYVYRQQAALDVPFTVFGGLDDVTTTTDNLSAWETLTARGASLSLFRGGHFFIEEARGEVLSAIGRVLLHLLESRALAAAET
jgi:medium-chain acyl-[acyl-carrier-protein] hydrolase